jgi:hypothetical protein
MRSAPSYAIMLDAGKNHLAIACPPLGACKWNCRHGSARLLERLSQAVSCLLSGPAIPCDLGAGQRSDFTKSTESMASPFLATRRSTRSRSILPSASCSRRCSTASLPREARTKPLPAITGSMSLESVGSPAR